MVSRHHGCQSPQPRGRCSEQCAGNISDGHTCINPPSSGDLCVLDNMGAANEKWFLTGCPPRNMTSVTFKISVN